MKIIRPITVTDSGAFSRGSTASYWDKTGVPQLAANDIPRFTYEPTDLTKPPRYLGEAASTNILLNSLINGTSLTTQSVTVTAQSYTLSFYGSGTIVLSGAAVGTVIGSNVSTIYTTFTFTPVDGSLTLTISGTVQYANLESGSVATSFIPTAGTPVSRSADVNTLSMLSLLSEIDYPVIDLTKLYLRGERIMDTSTSVHKVYESANGVTAPVTMTIAVPCVVTWVANGVAANTPIKFTTTGALPTGIVSGTIYYIKSIAGSADTFNISATAGGAAITTTGSQSGVHTAIASINYNKTPSLNPDIWLDAGSTNKWAMFDNTIESQTSNLDFVAAAVTVPSSNFVDTVVAMNITNGRSIRVVMTDPIDGVVFDSTFSLISNNGIQDMFSYFTEPITRISDISISGLPPYANAVISISIASTGETVRCGLIKLGLSKLVGSTQAGMSLGIQNYSVKSTDVFGNTTFVERAFARTMNLTVWIDNEKVDSFLNLLNSFRIIPIVYIGSDGFNSSIVFGVFKDYTNGIDYTTVSVLHLEIEGMK